jgi:predicted metal-dependent hydrolase
MYRAVSASEHSSAPAPAVADLLPVRRIHFEYPDDLDPAWIHDVPEFAYAANGLSLLMPYAEPLFIKAVRSAFDEPGFESRGPELRDRTENYVKQEVGHYSEHKRFNEIIRRHHPGVARVERWMKRCADWISTTRSTRFNLAFASGGEIMSFLLARWVDKHAGQLFGGADPVPTTLFMWHLAEEVEHKSSASDVYEAVDGSKLRYALAMVMGTVLLGWFAWLAALVMLRDDGRLFSPVSHWRLVRWALSLAIELFPSMLVSALPGHRPDDFANPILLTTWLRQYDPTTGTMPLWETASRTT